MRQGRIYHQRFGDQRHGGKQPALRKAIAHRDKMLSILPERSALKTSNSTNTSGVVGVYRMKQRTKKGRLSRHWCGSWRIKGRVRKRCFSIAKYGELTAKQLAIEARAEAVEQLTRWRGTPPPKTPRRRAEVPGVYYVQDPRTHQAYYRAAWTDLDGRRRTRSYSVNKYGRRKALALAVRARRYARKRLPPRRRRRRPTSSK